MRKVTWTNTNEFGDAEFHFETITPPDEVEGRKKYLEEEQVKRMERFLKASPKTLARVREIKARM